MKHVTKITRAVAPAVDASPGQILSTIAAVLTVLGQALVAKEGGSTT